MREANRPKSNLAFTLDSRQVMVLFIGGMVVVLGIFVLGVLVGQRLNGVAKPAEDTDLLEAVKKQTEQYEKIQEIAEKPETIEEKVEPEDSKPKPEVKPEPKKEPEAKATAENKPQPAIKEEPKPVAKAEKPKEEPKAEAPKAEPPKPEPEPKKLETAKPEPKQEKAPAPDGNIYTLQIASLPTKDRAKQFMKSFKTFDRRKPFITEAQVPGKGTWYRVKIGRFDTKEQAQAYQSIFEAKTGIQTILSLE